MLSYRKPSQSQPLALWEQVKQGKNIGIDTSRDFICPLCFQYHVYSKVATTDNPRRYRCPEHGWLTTVLPEYAVEESGPFQGQYEVRLIERIKMNQNVVTHQPSALVVQDMEMLRMKGLVRAGLVGLGDFGKHTDSIVTMVAHGALAFGLSPTTGEIFPYVEREKDVRQSDGTYLPGPIKKVTLGINYKGLARSARRQSLFSTPENEMRRLSAEEIKERGLHRVANWEWFKDRSKPATIEHVPEQCVAIELKLYRHDSYSRLVELGERAKAAGMKPVEVTPDAIAVGVWRPGDTIPAGRTAEWRAKIRAIKQAIMEAYDLSFALTSMLIDQGDVKAETQSPFVVEGQEGENPLAFNVDEIETPQPAIFEEAQVIFPGEPLDSKKQVGLKRLLSDQGVQAEVFIPQVLGEGQSLSTMTRVTAKNLVECAVRQKMVKQGQTTGTVLGHANLEGEALLIALEQECRQLCQQGAEYPVLIGAI